jgi:hypothetical protein
MLALLERKEGEYKMPPSPTTWAEFKAELGKNTTKAGADLVAFKTDMVKDAGKAKDNFNTKVEHLPHQSLEFANLIDATVGNFTNALSQTIPAFKEGRTKEGAAGLVQMISALTPMMGTLGPAGGAMGGLISVALGIISSILGAFEDQRKTLASEIKDQLSHLHAQLIHDELVAAMGDLERAYGPMHEVPDASRTWEQMQSGWINMFEGNATHQLNLTRSWLEKAENQDNEEWPLIFDCFWHVVDLRLLVFTLMVTKLKAVGGTNTDDPQRIGGMALKERRERDEAFAKQIYPVALNRGTLWHIGNSRDIYERYYIVTNIDNDYTDLKHKADLVMVGPITKSFYALDKGSGKITKRGKTATTNWPVIDEVKGGAIDLWVMPEPNKDGPAGERVVAVKKDGTALQSFVSSPTKTFITTAFQGNTNKISQFRSIQIGGSTYYICLGQNGKLYSGQPTDGRPPVALQLALWRDFGVGMKGISIGKNEQLSANLILAYGDDKIVRRQFLPAGETDKFVVPDTHDAWKPMDLPSAAKGKKITFAAACQSGHTLVCLNDKLWVFMPDSQNKAGGWNWVWKQETKGDMKAVYEEPIQGFDKYCEFWKTPST